MSEKQVAYINFYQREWMFKGQIVQTLILTGLCRRRLVLGQLPCTIYSLSGCVWSRRRMAEAPAPALPPTKSRKTGPDDTPASGDKTHQPDESTLKRKRVRSPAG